MSRPRTDIDLWEYVHRLFGIGDWDELYSPEPFWKYRQKEVMKVKAKRLKLKAEVEHLADAADYCKTHGIDVRNVAWLYRYLPVSRAWIAERERALSHGHLDELIAEAVDLERELGSDEWAHRLLRARGPHRQEVYELWKEARMERASRR